MDIPKIEQLDELLKDYLKGKRTVIDHETARLTAMGENYGSTMLALKIRLKNKDKTEILEVVAKIPPPGEFMQRMFNIPVTFRNEIDFYKTIVPELNTFFHEKGLDGYLDCIPKFLGSRFSLKPGKNDVDEDAVILLENLKIQGYEMLDRFTGFDLPTSKAIIKALAKFHAAPLALKLQKPETFQKLRSLFKPYKVFDFDDVTYQLVIDKIVKTIQGIDGCQQYVQNVEKALKGTTILARNAPDFLREPFATIIHTDVWVNNFMVRYHEDGTSCKIVDFQLDEYGSPARDLIFFLYTSVQVPVLKEHYEELVGLYHQIFLEGLARFGCEVGPFCREEFEKEIALAVKEYEFVHCMIMLEPIFATKDSLKELDQYNEEDMTRVKPISEQHLERAGFIVKDFVKRNWI